MTRRRGNILNHEFTMKILLVYPYFIDPRLHVEEIAAVPMGLYYVAATLKAHDHQVKICNWYDMGGRIEAIKLHLESYQPDIIGFSIVHANRWGAIDIAQLAKELDPRVKIVLGGIGATFLWEHLLTHFAQFDYVVVGEGEFAFLNLVEGIHKKASAETLATIAGLALRIAGQAVQPIPARPIADLDRLPPPARYFDFQHIALTRGCPGRCAFCGSPRFWGRKVRAHSADYFVDQLQLLTERGTTFFYVSDDTFTLNAELVIEVCRKIIQRGLKIVWQAISKVSAVRADVLYWMRKAGCIQISFGVESGSARIRRQLCKDISEGQIIKAFRMTTAHGILPRAYFIYGAPGENDDTIAETLALIDRIKPLSAIFYILDIFPGTALYDQFRRQTGSDDNIWLERKEDILYFENDPALSAASVQAFGRRLRDGFRQRLSQFALDIELKEDPSLAKEQADFLSRLGLTFSHGDYAALSSRPGPSQIAESLFQRALGLHPDHRAFWGAALLFRQQGRWSQAQIMAQAGVQHFPASPDLNICLAEILLSHPNDQKNKKNQAIEQVLEHLKAFEDHPRALALMEYCYRLKGNHQQVARCKALQERYRTQVSH
jgi:anaerobic magnesium-protoporphyrin IX monomethyl ester cyclase